MLCQIINKTLKILASFLLMAFVLLVGLLVALKSVSWAAEFSYEGRTITIIVSSNPGGTFDAAARLVARHLPRHLPGNPTMIVQNMPGAGDLVATNYMYNVAKPNGLTIGLVNSAVYADQLFQREGVRFDLRRFHWLGSPESGVRVGVMRTGTPYQTIEALRAAKKPPKIGYTGTSSGFYQMSRLAEFVLGIKINVIPGFSGLGGIRLAVERGELDGVMGLSYASLVSRIPQWLKEKLVNIIIQTGIWDEKSNSFQRHHKLPNVPTYWELASPDKRPIVKAALAPIEPVRPFFTPPGVPAERVKLLRDAMWATFHDPKYKSEAKRVFGVDADDLDPVSGEKLQRVMEDAQNPPKKVVEELGRIYK